MKMIRYAGIALMVLTLTACATTPPGIGNNSAVAANIKAHRLAKGALPVSTARMALAIQRYNKNESEPPVKMRTTENVSEE